MGIESFNRIHWTLLGLFLGAALAYAWSSNAGGTEGMPLASASTFESELISKKNDQPYVTDIVIHPAEYSLANNSDVNVITYKRLATDITTKKSGYLLDKWCIAKIPYKPVYTGRVMPPPASNAPETAGVSDAKPLPAGAFASIQDYLTELAKTPEGNQVHFKYGWWLIPKYAMGAGAGAGALLIGGIWPTLLGIMTGAGLGPKKKEKKASLWNYKSRGAEPGRASKPVITAAEQARLQNVADTYEKNLAAHATAHAKPGPAKSDHPEEKPRELATATLEASASQAAADDVEVKNMEFYPVLIHKKDQDSKPEH